MPERRAATARNNVVSLAFTKSARDGATQKADVHSPFKIAKALGTGTEASRKLLFATIAISVALHGGIIASMFARDSGEEFGTLADKTDAFSLSMEQSVVLESISTESVQMASSAAAASQAGSVQAVESKPQELAEAETNPVSDEPPPKPIDVADVTPTALAKTDDPLPVIRGGGSEQAVSEIKAAQIAQTEVKEMPDAVETKEDTQATIEKKKEDQKEKKTPQQESHQQVAGSSTSRSNAEQAALSGRVSASRGNALTYGAMVRAQLARNKPASNGVRGTVRVSFGISNDGEISYLRVSQSSGSAALDAAALAVVRKSAPFGEPPSDLTAAQLAYVIPFYFR
ncbi:MAG: TonB family protein [Hyphomicrobium sp.]|uniref:TonB family protein n=1 Tax=Hyphomicrobium sp. TaxID=82 RepID=UPI0039E2E2F3